jgi:hypothetical protein
MLGARVANFFLRVKNIFQFAFGQVGGVEEVTQLLAVQALEKGVVGIQFGADHGAAGFILPYKYT